jgi:hypothetical protein
MTKRHEFQPAGVDLTYGEFAEILAALLSARRVFLNMLQVLEGNEPVCDILQLQVEKLDSAIAKAEGGRS